MKTIMEMKIMKSSCAVMIWTTSILLLFSILPTSTRSIILQTPSIRVSLSGGKPSSSHLLMSGDGSSEDLKYSHMSNSKSSGDSTDLMNAIPDELTVSYLPVPFLWKTILSMGSLFAAVSVRVTSSPRLIETLLKSNKLNIFQSLSLVSFPIATYIKIGAIFLLTKIASELIIQDLYYGPSRVTIKLLEEKGYLPSKLSKLTSVKPSFITARIPSASESDPEIIRNDEITAHNTVYRSIHNQESDLKFDAIYFNHGFGASSLSWVPAIPKLVDTLKARVGVSHDVVGFGFTERPDETKKFSYAKSSSCDDNVNCIQYVKVDPYSFTMAAGIGNALLEKELEKNTSCTTSSSSSKSIMLVGHSMGCITTLKMANKLLKDYPSIKLHIILVAPAILASSSSTKQMSFAKKVSNTVIAPLCDLTISKYLSKVFRCVILAPIHILVNLLGKILLRLPMKYILRRMVGSKSFWKNGLTQAWGDPEKVTMDTVLRYEWPAVTNGWEDGILSFTKAQISSSQKESERKGGNQVDLLKEVLASGSSRTKILIVHGDKDSVIPISNSRKLVKNFPQIQIVEARGVGHNPHEEIIGDFVQVVGNFVK